MKGKGGSPVMFEYCVQARRSDQATGDFVIEAYCIRARILSDGIVFLCNVSVLCQNAFISPWNQRLGRIGIKESDRFMMVEIIKDRDGETVTPSTFVAVTRQYQVPSSSVLITRTEALWATLE